MRKIIRKAIVAGAAALGIAGVVVSTSAPAEAAFRMGGGGFGGGWHGGGFGGGGWRGGYGGYGWRGGYGGYGWRGYGYRRYGYYGWGGYGLWGYAGWACPGWGCGWGGDCGWGWPSPYYAGYASYNANYAPGCLVYRRVWTQPGRPGGLPRPPAGQYLPVGKTAAKLAAEDLVSRL